MVSFALLDWIWLILFIFLMVICGIIFYKLGKRSQSDFFLAGRGLPWWLPASSVYATHTATDTPIWVAGVVYKYGFAGLWYAFFAAWCAISAFVSTRIFRRSLAYSQAEWQGLRFGGLGAEMLRGWVAGWQVFMNMFILGWVGIAMGKLCNMLFGWELWIGLVVFTTLGAIYVLSSGYWGVVMADFQQGVIALLVIFIVSIWGVMAAGGPENIINKLKKFNSTCEWKVPDDTRDLAQGFIRITDPETKETLISSSSPFIISSGFNETKHAQMNKKVKSLIDNKEKPSQAAILFPVSGDTVFSGKEYNIVWTADKSKKLVNVEFSSNGNDWQTIAENRLDGQGWRINPFSFTGLFKGQFPVFWFVTMMIIALIGGFGMGTNIDWYTEAQRIQSAKTVRDASYSIWAGTALVLVRNSIWAAAIIGFFVLSPQLASMKEYEMAWYKVGFGFLPIGMVGFFFAGILAIHLSTVSTQLNLGAMYATRDFYHHYVNPKAKEQKLVVVGRISTFVILIGSFIFGTIIGEEITQWLIFALWIMAAGVWLPNILQVIWWRFNSWGYLSAWIANLGLSWLIVWVLPRFGIIPELPDYMQFWILVALNAMIYLPVTFLTKKENMDHLVKYYVMSRPIGFWGPVRKEAIKQGLM
ncbi:sodium:solute symporter [candidate division KSB1 bacterium 4572_119]|nr:MAG: sodium:solute symporter [candidate division KSB1 bacterium 4572_119]